MGPPQRMAPASTNSSLLWRSFTQVSPQYDPRELKFSVDELQVDHETMGMCHSKRRKYALYKLQVFIGMRLDLAMSPLHRCSLSNPDARISN